MDKYIPETWIGPLMDTVEDHLTKATRVYQNLTEEQLLASPPEGGWSVAQCLEHLNSYGHYYLPAVENALKKAPEGRRSARNFYTSGWLGAYFVKMMKPENTKKYKAFKDHVPAPQLDGAAVVAEFIRQQEQWLTLLAGISEVRVLNVRVPISISPFIRLKLGDVLGFVKAHDERHIQQANRVLASLSASGITPPGYAPILN